MSERNYWQRMRRRQLSRRALLGASARAGVGAAGLALVGCGDDDDDQQQQTAAQVQQAQPQQQQQQVAQQQQQDQAQQQAAAADAQDQGDQQDQPAVTAAPSGGITPGGVRTAPFVGPFSGDPPTLDPYENLTYRAQIPSGFTYSKLLQAISGAEGVNPGNTAEYEPDLAVSLPEIPDPTTYIFTLREDANWHDVDPLNGRPIVMDDIVQTHDRFQEISANAAGWNGVIANFAPGEDNSIRFDLHQPHAPFLTLAGSSQHLWIIPPEIVDDAPSRQRPVGSGPWVFESFEPGVAIRMNRNPNWHRSRDFGYDQQLPLMDGIIATMNGATDVLIRRSAMAPLDYSQLSAAIFKQAQDAAPQIEDDGYVFTLNTVPGGFYFNYSIPPWNDVRVRQALSMAMDRDDILAATDDTGRGAWHSPLSQIAPYWIDPKDLDTFGETYNGEPSGLNFHRNIAEARKLLDAAGYPRRHPGDPARHRRLRRHRGQPLRGLRRLRRRSRLPVRVLLQGVRAYIASIFRGNFPDDWDGESSHLGIGPLYGGATDPEDIWAAVYSRNSGRHNWGSAGRTPDNLANVLELDTGGNAEIWSHPNAVSAAGPRPTRPCTRCSRPRRRCSTSRNAWSTTRTSSATWRPRCTWCPTSRRPASTPSTPGCSSWTTTPAPASKTPPSGCGPRPTTPGAARVNRSS